MGYTNGPWVVDGEHGEYVSQQYEDETGIAHVLCIDEAGDGWVRGQMTHANARLIAAAPDLLEALIDIADDYSERFDMDSPSTNPGMKQVVAAARKAITRAKGEAE